MKKLSKPSKTDPNFSWDVESPTKTARLRMVELPTDESRDLGPQAVFPAEALWVPVAVVNGNVHILPGVPRLCMLSTFFLFSFLFFFFFFFPPFAKEDQPASISLSLSLSFLEIL